MPSKDLLLSEDPTKFVTTALAKWGATAIALFQPASSLCGIGGKKRPLGEAFVLLKILLTEEPILASAWPFITALADAP